MMNKMWSKIESKIFHWIPNGSRLVSLRTEIKEVHSIKENSIKNKQGYILLWVPFSFSRTFIFFFLSNLFPSLFSYISYENLHSVYKIQELEANLRIAETEKENLINQKEFSSKALDESNADKITLQKKYDEMAEKIENIKELRNETRLRKYAQTFDILFPSSYYLVWGAMLINIIMCFTVFISIMSYVIELEDLMNNIMELLVTLPVHFIFMTTVFICLYFW